MLWMLKQEEEAWLCSACLRLVNGSPGPALAKRLGWTQPLPATVLAAQLLELGKLHGQVSISLLLERCDSHLHFLSRGHASHVHWEHAPLYCHLSSV